MSMTTSSPPAAGARAVPAYEPAVSPRLRVLLLFTFAAFAVLGASGAYLAAITLFNWIDAPNTYTNPFTLWMFIVHVGLGVIATLPFLVFGVLHWLTARKRPNRLAVKLGLALFFSGILVCLSGLALIQLEGMPQLPTGTLARGVTYVLHLALPVVAVGLYLLHRRAGPDIQWKYGIAWGLGVGCFVAGMVVFHAQDPRQWYAVGPVEGEKYFFPSLARTSDGNFIPAETLMMDQYCMKCHQDIYDDWFHSAHHFSSFNNPPYLLSVRETRKVSMERDGNMRAARWCAGCHDPVPFFSGAFDDPNFDDVNHPTAHAGITCTVCHAITNVNSTRGNADYTIEEPQHYPLAFSEDPFLQWVNNQVVKAKPDFHKRTFLKPFHKTAEFCSTCHKVHLPIELNHYKEFLRGQNHYDSYLLSGVSGHGVRSFYYPKEAQTNCNGCHMPLKPSGDFGSKDFDGSGERKVHDHLFPGANTGLFDLLARTDRYGAHAEGFRKAIDRTAEFLRDKQMHVDIFGLKEGGTIDGKLHAPLRPELPELVPGRRYLVEVVVRTLALGHPFTQGTADSNEVWVDFEAKAGGRVIARSGALEDEAAQAGPLDPWAHRINVLMLDRHGNRINRRNPQDIFTPLYNHQIPPGAGQVVHYLLDVPDDVREPVTLTARVRFRKFDYEYMKLVHPNQEVPVLPIVDMCADAVTLPVAGAPAGELSAKPPEGKPGWQRWNDYGIACLLEGGADSKKGELRQAAEAFLELTRLGEKDAVAHGWLNLARVYIAEGRLAEAAEALEKARTADPPAPWWSLAWFNGIVTAQNATEKEDFDAAIAHFEQLLDPANQPVSRKFDFRLDYVLLNKLGDTLFKRSQLEGDDPAAQERLLLRAVGQFEKTLAIDSEDLGAH